MVNQKQFPPSYKSFSRHEICWPVLTPLPIVFFLFSNLSHLSSFLFSPHFGVNVQTGTESVLLVAFILTLNININSVCTCQVMNVENVNIASSTLTSYSSQYLQTWAHTAPHRSKHIQPVEWAWTWAWFITYSTTNGEVTSEFCCNFLEQYHIANIFFLKTWLAWGHSDSVTLWFQSWLQTANFLHIDRAVLHLNWFMMQTLFASSSAKLIVLYK